MLKKFMRLDQSHKSIKAQPASRLFSKKVNQSPYNDNLMGFKNIQVSNLLLKFFTKNVNLRNLLTQFIKMRIHTTVAFVVKFFPISLTKNMFKKFIRFEQPQKRVEVQVAIRFVLRKVNQNTNTIQSKLQRIHKHPSV